jgi:FAD/FMN-containing dehydrogenase
VLKDSDLKWVSALEHPADCDAYSRDWNGHIENTANAVFFPTSSEQVEECFDICRKNNWRIVPRGGNTGLSGGTLLLSEDLAIVSTSRLRECLRFDEKNQLLTVSAGFTLQEINEYLETFGMIFPLHMGSYGSAMIGGVVSTNAGGMQAWRYGMARNLVAAVECVSPNFGVMTMPTSNLKNNLGIMPVDCIIGSEGYYGLVTEVNLRVTRRNVSDIGLVIIEDDFDKCQTVFNRIQAELADFIDIVEFVSGQSPGADKISPILQASKWGLIIKLTASLTQDGLGSILERFIANIADFEHTESIYVLSSRQTSEVIAAREALPAVISELGGLLKFDLRLDLVHFQDFHLFLIELLGGFPQAKFSFFGHYQDGNIHLNVSLPAGADGDFISNKILQKVSLLGGAIAAEHGLGRAKRKLISPLLDPKIDGLRNQLKPFFDQEGLLA